MLGQLSGQQKTDDRFDFTARGGRALVVVGQTGGLAGDALEDVVDERVHDGHGPDDGYGQCPGFFEPKKTNLRSIKWGRILQYNERINKDDK